MNSDFTILSRPLPEPHKKLAFAILTAIFFLYWWQPGLTYLGVIALLLAIPVVYLMFRLLDGDARPILLLWVAVFPLGYYFLSFPRGGGTVIISLDRVTVLWLAAGIALCPRDRVTRIPQPLQRCAWAWMAFVIVTFLSLLTVTPVHTPLRLWLEAFVLPAILGWYVVACFPVRSYLNLLHGIICSISIYSAAIGAAEMVLGRDLLAQPGGGGVVAGSTLGSWVLRPSGPYMASHSFGMIGLATFFLLLFLRQIMPKDLPRWHRVLHGFGTSAAMLQSMMTLHRSIYITIILIFILDLFRRMTRFQKALRVGIISAIGTLALVISLTVPELFVERVSDPGSIYQRIAQQEQNLRLFLEHPLLGVGFANFYQVASRKPSLTFYYQGVDSMDVPHSNVGQVLTETGLIGFAPYALSQILLISAFWRPRRSSADGILGWTCFVNIFLAYWIQGFAMASGFYPDLNLWYMFCFAVVYKYVITARVPEGSIPTGILPKQN